MTTFDEREMAFENSFEHGQDLLFKIRARRDRLAGLWAADLLGLSGEAADSYARQLLDADVAATGPHDVRDRIAADLHARGVDISDHRVEKQLTHLLEVARQQVMQG